MTLGTLSISIAIVALILTLASGFLFKNKVKNWLVSFLQYFAGALFVFSGAVKAIDPLGTAYKMEQYFAEFTTTFEGTWFSFIAPLFPWLSHYSTSFSVFMIVFEIVLGLALLIGAFPKLTSWAFLLLVAFFTFLTGFTFLTAFVPEGVNFFQFAKWGPYVETNMKVTDCGCFGDFMVLKPKISFFKDLVLLVPSIIFVWKSSKMHQWLKPVSRLGLLAISSLVLVVYCMSNYVWNLPDIDFRPFKEGVNIAERKALEAEAEANVEIIAWKLKNRQTGEIKELPYEEYLAKIQDYPKDQWEVVDQIKSEPTVAHTKISDFEVSDLAGNSITEELFADSNYHFMVVAYKLYGETSKAPQMVNDTIFALDTLRVGDSLSVQKKVKEVKQKEILADVYNWDPKYISRWSGRVNDVLAAAQKSGMNVRAVTAFNDENVINNFQQTIGADFLFYTADDILLKTIIRSNPGLVLMKGGKVIKHWHYRQLPEFEKIKAGFLK